jgi:asparagine synthase (glutamine-hydrolysing)
LNAPAVLANFDTAGRVSRKVWGLLSLELWHQIFHDQSTRYRRTLSEVNDVETRLAAGVR